MKAKATLLVVIVSFIIGCYFDKTTNEYNMAYDMLCKLAYISSLVEMKATGAVTPKMEAYLESTEYNKISDRKGCEMFRSVFETLRKALSEKNFFMKAMLIGAVSQVNIIRICSYYKFPECKTFEFKFTREEIPRRIPPEVLLRALNDLMEKGKKIWTE